MRSNYPLQVPHVLFSQEDMTGPSVNRFRHFARAHSKDNGVGSGTWQKLTSKETSANRIST